MSNQPIETPNEPAEPTMAEYAAMRASEMSGEPAAVIEAEETAVATEKPAATTEEKPDNKTTLESATEENDPEIEEEHPAKKGIDKKFSKLTSARDKAIAEADAARKEALEAKAEAERFKVELEEARRLPVVPKPEEDLIPDREAYDDPDEFDLARSAWVTRQEIRKSNEAAEAEVQKRKESASAELEAKRQEQVQAQITTLHKNFNERVEKAAEEYPDFAEKVTNNESLVLRNDVFFTIEQSEMAPHILYHLSNNTAEAEALNNLPPIQAAMYLGELQARLRETRKPRVSKAAEPIKPIGNRGTNERKTPDEMDVAEYAEHVNKQKKNAGGNRRFI